jgi:hypothetical protein
VTEEAVLIIAVLAALLAMAVCAVVLLAVTLPDRVARMLAARAVTDAGGIAASRALVRQLADTATAHREILAEQAELAATYHGLAKWLVDVALRGRPSHPPRPREHRVVGASRQPDHLQPPDTARAGEAGCRLAPASPRHGRRVVIPGPWQARPGEGVGCAAAGGGETDDAS